MGLMFILEVPLCDGNQRQAKIQRTAVGGTYNIEYIITPEAGMSNKFQHIICSKLTE
jgi:hypothetical protein